MISPSTPTELRLQREKIGMRLDRGTLPTAGNQKIYGGYGEGQACAGCDEPVRETEVIYEVEVQCETEAGVVVLNLHRWCFDLWMEECLVRRRRAP